MDTEGFTNLEEMFSDTSNSTTIATSEKKDSSSSKDFLTALDLYNKKVEVIPTLISPFLQKVGLASLVGTSDSGKSTFLRQLSLSIALHLETFLGFKIDSATNKVIYVSTEDDSNAISFSIKKQVDFLLQDNSAIDITKLKNLQFIFETENLLRQLTKLLAKEPVDLIIIDAFTDVFTKELNANTQVRQFLNQYDKLAKKYNCLILFLHHIGKNTIKATPSKDSIIGSQAFEAKMRVVLELRPNKFNSNRKDLWVLKGNFLDANQKNKSHIIEMNDSLIFNTNGERGEKLQISKITNPSIIDKVKELKNQGLTLREIEKNLKGTDLEISKSAISQLLIKETAKMKK